jgi:hypothetical protein
MYHIYLQYFTVTLEPGPDILSRQAKTGTNPIPSGNSARFARQLQGQRSKGERGDLNWHAHVHLLEKSHALPKIDVRRTTWNTLPLGPSAAIRQQLI